MIIHTHTHTHQQRTYKGDFKIQYKKLYKANNIKIIQKLYFFVRCSLPHVFYRNNFSRREEREVVKRTKGSDKEGFISSHSGEWN